MVGEELLALELVLDSQRDPARLDRIGAENREVLENDPEFRIALDEGLDILERPFAVPAIVVEELDQGDVARGIARNEAVRRVQKRLADFLQRGALGHALALGLPLLELGHDLLENLGILQEVFPDDLPDRLFLRLAEGRAPARGLRRCIAMAPAKRAVRRGMDRKWRMMGPCASLVLRGTIIEDVFGL